MKKIFIFILLLIPWFLSTLIFNFNDAFYNSLTLPFFTPPSIIFSIIWFILYFLIALSIYYIYQQYKYKEIKEYNTTLLVNYLANQLFPFFFFILENTFLAFADAVVVLISSLFLYYETKRLNVQSSKLLIPYIIWNTFAVLLALIIYLFNF